MVAVSWRRARETTHPKPPVLCGRPPAPCEKSAVVRDARCPGLHVPHSRRAVRRERGQRGPRACASPARPLGRTCASVCVHVGVLARVLA
eukprot:2433193-Pleurochrysis_carterae.AAC.3